jgi:hypothetical protein
MCPLAAGLPPRKTASMVDASTHWIRPAARPGSFRFAPRRHRRASAPPWRTAGLVGTAAAALLFFVFAFFMADSDPIGPDAPTFGALPPPASPDVTPTSAASVDPTPAGSKSPPATSHPEALAQPVSINRTVPAAAAQQPSPGVVAPAPRLAATTGRPRPSPAPAVPEPSPQPPVPQPSPQPPRSEPTPPEPPPPSQPAPPSPPDDRTPLGKEKPRGNPSPPGHRPKSPGPKVDQRYAGCADVLATGLGPYKAGRDVEYDWYPDPDADGWACESPHPGMGHR